MPLAKSDTALISLYIQVAEADEDSTSVLHSDTAMQMVNALLPKANAKMKNDLYAYLSYALYYKATHFVNIEEYDSAIYYLQKSLEPAVKINDRIQEAKVLNDIGVCYYHQNNLPFTIDYLKRSLSIREELKEDDGLRNAYNNMAFIYKETGMVDSALVLNFKSLAIAEKSGTDGDIAVSYNNIGQIYHVLLLDYDKGLEYYKKSLALREKIGVKKDIALQKNNIGAVYSDMGNNTEALKWYNEALQLRRAINHKYGIINTLNNIASTYIRMKDYEKPKAFLAEALELNKSLKDNNMELAIQRNYAAVYKELKEPDNAILHAKLSHELSLASGNPLHISISARMLSEVYEMKGDYKESLSFFKLFKTMQDSTLNDKLRKEGVKKQVEYEYLKKKNESDKVYEKQLADKNFVTWMLALVFIAAGIIGYILYNRYKLKQQLKEIEIRNKIASDLHDDVGSTLSSIRMYSGIVRNQPNQTETASQLLDKISNNSQEMIESMSDIVWMIKPGNDDFKNVENRMLNFANELCVPAGINFEFNKDMSDEIKIPMEQRRDLYLIFKEAVNNAVKYSGCSTIRAVISQKPGYLYMQIQDDGKGFDTKLIANGNGVGNIRKRAEENGGNAKIISSYGNGTAVSISFKMH